MMEIETAAEAIDALGGDHAVAKLYDRTVQAVRNWRYGRGVPPGLRPDMDARLRARGKKCSSSVYSAYKPYAVKVPHRMRRKAIH